MCNVQSRPKIRASDLPPTVVSSSSDLEEPIDLNKDDKCTNSKFLHRPHRPLCAYNLFFQLQRDRIVRDIPIKDPITHEDVSKILSRSQERVKSNTKRRHRKQHGKIGFKELAKIAAENWRNLDSSEKEIFEHFAQIEQERYRQELKNLPCKKERKRKIKFASKEAKSLQDCICISTGIQPLTNLFSAKNFRFSKNSIATALSGSIAMSSFTMSDPPLPRHCCLDSVMSANVCQSNSKIAQCDLDTHFPPMNSDFFDTCIADTLGNIQPLKIDEQVAEDFWENASISSMSSMED